MSSNTENKKLTLVGNISIEPTKKDFISKFNNENVEIGNFAINFKNEHGFKVVVPCFAYNDKIEQFKDFKKGDFVKVFGEVTTMDSKRGKKSTFKVIKAEILMTKENIKNKNQDKTKEKNLDNKDIKNNDKNLYQNISINQDDELELEI